MGKKWLRVTKLTVLFCLAVALLTPVLAKEINEKKYQPEDFLEVINIGACLEQHKHLCLKHDKQVNTK